MLIIRSTTGTLTVEGESKEAETAPVLDLKVLAELRRVCDSEEGLETDEFLELFVRELKSRVGAIRAALDGGECDALAVAAHALDGSSSLIGALAMAEICRELEEGGRKGAIGARKSWLIILDREERSLRDALSEIGKANRP